LADAARPLAILLDRRFCWTVIPRVKAVKFRTDAMCLAGVCRDGRIFLGSLVVCTERSGRTGKRITP
jgi:hypothetical protein